MIGKAEAALAADGGTYGFLLENGWKWFVIPDHCPPIVTPNRMYKIGSADEPGE
ncbi:hypothetical protein [Mesorhizobium sp. Cs1321R2N1]|uniref:hypothetical protein n=1 Tax=Mesorhizobium sp. Cs1321R2N1 TaxID=3015174 RepID=UPI00301B9DE5